MGIPSLGHPGVKARGSQSTLVMGRMWIIATSQTERGSTHAASAGTHNVICAPSREAGRQVCGCILPFGEWVNPCLCSGGDSSSHQ